MVITEFLGSEKLVLEFVTTLGEFTVALEKAARVGKAREEVQAKGARVDVEKVRVERAIRPLRGEHTQPERLRKALPNLGWSPRRKSRMNNGIRRIPMRKSGMKKKKTTQNRTKRMPTLTKTRTTSDSPRCSIRT